MTALFTWAKEELKRNDGHTIELLSPAGDRECFIAAIHSGADAVYAGGNRFGARAYANNLSSDELLYAIDYAHLYGRRFYLTVNTVLKNAEIKELYEYIAPLYEAGLDGVIVQDLGVLSIISTYFPFLPIHASTQMAVTDAQGVMLIKELGVKRVVPARELSLSEIKDIYSETNVELECFIHGAMCYSYSGKCLFSSLVGGRSGNRGRCAQPCRLPYDDKYILSLRDMQTIELLPELINSGIASFKIEGRMKSPEYVACVTGIYRKYIDRYLSNADEAYTVDKDDLLKLDKIYSRSGHCSGYYHKHNGRNMISLIRPSYSTMEKDAIKNLSERYTAHTGKIKIDGSVSAKRNKPLKVELSLGGTKALYEGAIVDMAKTRPTDRNEIEKQMRRLGDTCFDFSSLEVSADDDIFIPVSALNKARREAVRLLETRLLSEYRRLRTEVCNIHIPAGYDQLCDEGGPYINCRIDKGEMLDTVLCHDLVDTVTIDASMLDPENINYFDDRVHGRGVKLFLALPMIIRNKYFERNKYITDALRMGIFDGVIADNLESLYHLKQCGYSGIVVSDIHMYAANDISVSVLKSLGADVITYPVELNAKELSSLKLERGEFIIYGRMPMMVSAQCIKKTLDKCSHNSEMGEIRDRYGNIFPYVSNCSECYNVILNCVPNMILPNFELPKGLKPYSYRIHFTVEDKASINGVLDLYGDILVNKKERTLNIEHTLGHLKRGVE